MTCVQMASLPPKAHLSSFTIGSRTLCPRWLLITLPSSALLYTKTVLSCHEGHLSIVPIGPIYFRLLWGHSPVDCWFLSWVVLFDIDLPVAVILHDLCSDGLTSNQSSPFCSTYRAQESLSALGSQSFDPEFCHALSYSWLLLNGLGRPVWYNSSHCSHLLWPVFVRPHVWLRFTLLQSLLGLGLWVCAGVTVHS